MKRRDNNLADPGLDAQGFSTADKPPPACVRMGTGGPHAIVGASTHKCVTAERSARLNESPPTHAPTAGRDEK